MEVTLLNLDEQGVLEEMLEDGLDVLFLGLRENQNVIKLYKDKLVKHVLEHVADQGLEYSRCTGEPERHDEIFVVACWVC